MIDHERLTILINHLTVTKPLLKSCARRGWRFNWFAHCSGLTLNGSTLAALHKSTSRQNVLLNNVGIRHLDVEAKITQEVTDHSDCTLDKRQTGFGLSHDGQHLFRSLKHVLVVVWIKAILLGFGCHLRFALLDHFAQDCFHLRAERTA